MTTILDQIGVAGGAIVGSGRPRDAGRADGWLLALERELLANLRVKNTAQPAVERERTASEDAGTSSQQEAANDAMSTANMAQGPADSNALEQRDQATAGTTAEDDTGGQSALDRSARNCGAQAIVSQHLPPAAPAMDSAYVALPTANAIASSAGTGNLSMAVVMASNGRTPAAAASETAPVTPMQRLAVARVPGQPLAAPSQEKAETQGAAGQPLQARTQDGTTYAQRQLHLYHSENGVQAWLRDTGISASQAIAVALAMNKELSDSGEKLVALTLNGKKIAYVFGDRQDTERGSSKTTDSGTSGSPLQSMGLESSHRMISKEGT